MWITFINGLKVPKDDRVKSLINQRNLYSTKLFLLFGLLTAVITTTMQISTDLAKNSDYTICLAIYFLLILRIHFDYFKNRIEHATLALYIIITPVLASSIVLSTYYDPKNLAFTFMIYLIALPLFILDHPLRLIGYTTFWTVVFIICDFTMKNYDLFLYDMLHLTECYLISVAITLFILSARISNLLHSAEVQSSSEHDALTGIYNRGGGDKLLCNYVSNGIQGTFLFMDVDNFKHINDAYGHASGDEVLKQVAKTLTEVFRRNDIIMRMGGDEFIVYAPDMMDPRFVDAKLTEVNEKMRLICADPKTDDYISVSIGCVINDGTYPGTDDLKAEADRQLYYVKEHGKNGHRIQDASYVPGRAKTKIL